MAREKDCYPAKAACIGPQTPCLPQTQTPDFPRNNLSFRTQMQDFLPQPLFPTRLKLLLLLSILQASTLHPTSASREGADYAACAEARVFSCGSFSTKISYPFLADGRQGICGLPEFQILCESGNPLMSLKGLDRNFSLRAIDYKNKVFTLAEEVSLPPVDDDSCPENLTETTILDAGKLDYQLFSVMEETESLLLFSCVEPLPPLDKGIGDVYKLNCSSAVGTSTWWFMVVMNGWSPMGGPPLNCSYRLSTWLHRTAVDRLKKQEQGFSTALSRGFDVTWKAAEGWCDECTRSGGVCGYNSSEPSMRLCLCSGGNRGGSCASEGHKLDKKMKVLIALVSLAAVFLLALLAFYLWRRRGQRQTRSVSRNLLVQSGSADFSADKDPEALAHSSFHTFIFPYEELEVATGGFDSSRELGDGGFGVVYKGNLKDGRVVAVKRLHERNYRHVQQFRNEVAILSRIRHPNLVSLYGCTSTQDSHQLLLVYEYVPNGTLADHLHGSRASDRLLTWPLRLSIAVETAAALTYLHASEPQIIHRDVKTSNILLDNDFHVKVADFGLSRQFPSLMVTHVSTAPQGTPGYVDPEYHQCYQLTDKSDVYSFGVVLIELLSSMPAVDMGRPRSEINLSNMAMARIPKGMLHDLVDHSLGFDTEPEVKRMMEAVAELAFRCLQPEKDMRPSMDEVRDTLVLMHGEDHGLSVSPLREQQMKDDTCLLTSSKVTLSPDTVVADWASRSTTPNASS